MTPALIITEVRRLIQDENTPVRYSDAVLLGFVNQTLKRMATLRPDLFTTVTDIPTSSGQVYQVIPSNGGRLVEIFGVTSGEAIEEVNRDEFNRAYPAWKTDPAGVPTKYMRHSRNPKGFFVYPRPQSGVELLAEYVVSPPNYTLSQTITNPPAEYFTVLVDGTVFLAESVDNEHVSSGRAKLFYDSFVQSLGVSGQARDITDTESGGVSKPPEA
jgi:hypothetical protein